MYWVSMGWYGMVGMFGVLSFSFDYRSMFCYWWVMDWIRSLSISMLSFMVYAVELFVNGCFSLFMGCLGYVSLDYGVYMWVMYMMLVD